MTQNNGWSYGGNDGVTDATRPLQNVNGQASYQPQTSSRVRTHTRKHMLLPATPTPRQPLLRSLRRSLHARTPITTSVTAQVLCSPRLCLQPSLAVALARVSEAASQHRITAPPAPPPVVPSAPISAISHRGRRSRNREEGPALYRDHHGLKWLHLRRR